MYSSSLRSSSGSLICLSMMNANQRRMSSGVFEIWSGEKVVRVEMSLMAEVECLLLVI